MWWVNQSGETGREPRGIWSRKTPRARLWGGREGNQETEWDVGLIGWRGRSLGLWLEVGTGANPEIGIRREMQFWGDTEAAVGPSGYEGPKRRCLGYCGAPGLGKRGEVEAEQR